MFKTAIELKLKTLVLALSFGLSLGINAEEVNYTALTAEELRIEKALNVMPSTTTRLNGRIEKFSSQLVKANNYTVLTQLIIRHGKALWLDAKASFNQLNDYDDRALYWARLQMTKALRSSNAFKALFPHQQHKLLWSLELLSRGQMDVQFDKSADKKILLTGFDPFHLDNAINQSNPSGVVALALDDLVVSIEGQTAEIEVLIIPVRFADFDQGMIEELLRPYIESKSVDLVLTTSMGRDHFDLERFPGLRRSAFAPDNLNMWTGATKTAPLVPNFKAGKLQGPEFVEFSLPVLAMKQGAGKYKVNDNRTVSTLSNGTFSGQSLASLVHQTSVRGSGGGYLSNEISYRSILLRNQYNLTLPVGHIHTPKISGFDQQELIDIVNQTKAIITQGVVGL